MRKEQLCAVRFTEHPPMDMIQNLVIHTLICDFYNYISLYLFEIWFIQE